MPNGRDTGERLSRVEIAWLPIVLAALLLVYLPGLGNNLVYDDSYLTEGLFSEYASIAQLHVRMLSYGSFVWLQALFGDGWWKQRLFNLLAHGAVVVALWALYREILRHIVATGSDPSTAAPYHRSPALGLAIGFFALNPVAVYAVAYLIQRSIVLATLFTVLALWLFALGLRKGKPALHVLAIACYALAVMSKEHAVLAPLAAIPLYILVKRPGPRQIAVAAVGGGILVAIVGAILYQRYADILGKPFDETSRLYLAQLSQLDAGAGRHAYLLSIVNESWLFFRYGVDWILPYAGWMSIDLRPPFPLHAFSFPQCLGPLGYAAVVAGGFVLLFRYRDGRALLGVSLLIPALLFATEFSTVWVQDPFTLYRSYLWAIGVPGLVFFALHGPSPRALLAVGAVAAALLSWQAIDRVLSMATAESVWTDAIAKLPSDPRAVGRWFPYLNRGSAYVDQNLFNLALADFRASAALGDQGMGMFNMGAVLSAQERPREALEAFDQAERAGYSLYNLPFQRGLAFFALGRVEDGYRQMQATLASSPGPEIRGIALLQLGKAAIQLGKRDEAKRAFQELLALNPRDKEGRYYLGMAYVMTGEPERARAMLDTLVADEPGRRAYYARALANFALKRKADALSDIDRALALGPDDPGIRAWQAKIRAMP